MGRRTSTRVLCAAVLAVLVAAVSGSAAAVSFSISPGGPPVTVTISTAGTIGTATFTGTAGQRVSLNLTGSTIAQYKVTLVKQSGPTVFTVSATKSPKFVDTNTLPSSGTYKLTVDPGSSYTGKVTLQLYDVPADASASATLGGAPGTVTTTVPGQGAYVTFAGVSGQRVALSLTNVTVSSGSVTVLNPDASVLAPQRAFARADSFIDPLDLSQTGVYTVVLNPKAKAVGSVTVTAYDVPSDQTQAITAGGPPVTVTTTVPGQNGYLTFTATAGQRVTVLVENVNGLNPAELDLQKQDGTQVIPAPLTVTSAGAWTQTVTLSAAGNYRILLDPQQANVGTADLSLFTVPADLSGAIAPGTPLTVTTTAPGQNASYTFTGVVNQRVSLNLTSVSMSSVKVFVRKPDGSNLIVKTVGTSGGFAEPAKLPVGGQYKVVVDPQSSYYGSVTVGLYVVPADTTGALTLGTPLTITTTVPGQNATRTFNGTAGQRISFNFTAVTMASVKVIVRTPGPSPLTVLQRTVGTDGDFVDPVTLPAGRTGVYTVTIDPQGASTGSVTLTFYNVPADATGSTSVSTTVPGQNGKLTSTTAAGTHTLTVSTNVPAPAGQTQSVSLTVYQGTTTTPANQIGFGTAGPAGNTFDVVFGGGTYTIVVNPFGAATGNVSVALS